MFCVNLRELHCPFELQENNALAYVHEGIMLSMFQFPIKLNLPWSNCALNTRMLCHCVASAFY